MTETGNTKEVQPLFLYSQTLNFRKKNRASRKGEVGATEASNRNLQHYCRIGDAKGLWCGSLRYILDDFLQLLR
jgi:hypothetical protein